jgi:hypothetical protein
VRLVQQKMTSKGKPEQAAVTKSKSIRIKGGIGNVETFMGKSKQRLVEN